MRSKGTVEHVCQHCGQAFTVRLGKLTAEYRARFCSRPCSAAARRGVSVLPPPPPEKPCKDCGEVKPLSEYTLRSESGRPRAECRVCQYNREQRRRWRKYGTTAAEYVGLLLAQGGVCAICRRDPERRHLSVDHDHLTGAIRGLLCRWCNMGIGSFREREDLLLEAIAYLKR